MLLSVPSYVQNYSDVLKSFVVPSYVRNYNFKSFVVLCGV